MIFYQFGANSSSFVNNLKKYLIENDFNQLLCTISITRNTYMNYSPKNSKYCRPPQYKGSYFFHNLKAKSRNPLTFSTDVICKSSWFSRQCVGLSDEKPGFESQARHQNEIRKEFLRRFPLSRFLAKTLRVNKIAMKSFSKNLSLGFDFKQQIPPLVYKN